MEDGATFSRWPYPNKYLFTTCNGNNRINLNVDTCITLKIIILCLEDDCTYDLEGVGSFYRCHTKIDMYTRLLMNER